ncbi:MAG: iron-sulfur cluster insertion protein ErpA [Candidatus Methylomirabilales bacterium]
MITITDAAAAKLKNLMAEEGVQDQALRIKVMGGGCSGYQYQLAFDSPQEKDKVFEKEGVKVAVDPKSYLFVVGAELDFLDGLHGAGFSIKNPNAKGSCGCGQSFHA